MKLVLAEKPSVAQSLAKVVGATVRNDGFLEGSGYIVSWCVGHLIELSEPEAYDPKYGKWSREDLPIMPVHWQYQITPSTQKQYSILHDLLHREDVESIVNACDAGREGELIFRLVYEQSRCTKPIERLWISSMEDSAIRDGFANLKPGAEYDRLYQAALCRERADWLVGINGTRLFSCLYRKTLNVGRVMTPTLAMVVLRDAQINSFQSEPFHTLQFDVGRMSVASERFKDRQEAESVQEQCLKDGWIKVISVKRQEKTEHPPLLYDLTSLQRDANRMLGYTAQQTLDYAQSLYEKKLITYPRTDSHYLTADMESSISDLGDIVNCSYPHCHEGDYLTGKVINNQKVTDHHAIIPTKEIAKALLMSMPKGEQEILQLIAVRLLCAISDDYRYSETELRVSCAGTEFTGKCKETLCLGWHEIRDCFYPPKKQEPEKRCAIADGAILPFIDSKIVEGKTHPPKHYTEDSLLSSMQNAAKEDMPEDAERQGIGTPATRAGIIEKLVNKGYVERYGNRKSTQLRATEKGNALITVMPEQLQAVSMTAEWEQRLLDIERGAFSPDEFIANIQTSISELVANYKVSEGAEFIMAERTVIGTCPHCGNSVTESQKGWFCSNRSCRFVLWKENAFFRKIGKRLTAQIAKNLLSNGHSRLKDCKNQSTNKTYNATVHMTTDTDGKPVFNLSFENGGDRRYEKKE